MAAIIGDAHGARQGINDSRTHGQQVPIDRYPIGDRTPGLRRDRDGSFMIVIQHEQPADTFEVRMGSVSASEDHTLAVC
jgi:hypothetical protein